VEHVGHQCTASARAAFARDEGRWWSKLEEQDMLPSPPISPRRRLATSGDIAVPQTVLSKLKEVVRALSAGIHAAAGQYAHMLHSIPRRRVIAGMAAFGLWDWRQGSRRRNPGLRSRPPGRSRNGSPPTPMDCAMTDLDAATLERVKSHFIDTIGCGIAAFDERPVRICRDVALIAAGAQRPSSARTGAPRLISPPSPTAPPSATTT